jgi:DNA transposition AAA+ family ATPase
VIATDAPSRFLITSQYRRFAEICRKSQTSKFISLFYGKTGLGKTESAYYYTNWRAVEPLIDRPAAARVLPASIVQCSAAVYTPDVGATAKMVQSSIATLRNRFDELVDQAASWHRFDTGPFYPHKHLKLLIIDEADRLKLDALEAVTTCHQRSPKEPRVSQRN